MSIAIGNSTISDVKIGTTSVSAVYIGTTQVWSGTPVPSYTGFYVEDVSGSANSIDILKNDASAPTLTIETSADGQTWSTLGQTDDVTALTVSIPANGKTYVRCNTTSWGDSVNWTMNSFINATGNFKVGGNIMSLLYGSNFTGNETTFPTGSTHTFYNTFQYINELTDITDLELPAMTLTQNCYDGMFSGCTSITATPVLTATTLANGCYQNMFNGCTSLTAAPVLPVLTLAQHCYSSMFGNCTSLTTPPSLPATTLANGCYAGMFGYSGLTTAPALNCTTLAESCYSSMFYGCEYLTAAPALPATTLAQECYGYMFGSCTSLVTPPTISATTLATFSCRNMFEYCTSLTTAPALNATTLGIYCYYQMFMDCTSLTAAPALPATTLVSYCYQDMFHGCTSLTQAPALPATSLGQESCSGMFMNCTSLTTAPALNATNLGYSCYSSMFDGCSSLTAAPVLPATNLTANCYAMMFQGCTSLTTVPSLPATTLNTTSYTNMFYGCTSLTNITCLAENISASDCTTSWLDGVAANGIFYKSANMSSWTTGVNGIPSGWTVVNDPSTYDYTEPFYFEDLSGNANTIYLNNTGSTPSVAWGADVYVSTDKTNWSTIGQIGVDSIEIPVTANGKTYVKVETTAYSDGTDCYFFGGADDNFAIGGNIDSLIYGMNFTGSETGFDTDYAFDRLFYGNSYLVDASKLIIPSGDTGDYMLHQMFSDCISLTDAPEWLFPTTLGDYCYSDMFNGCTSLAKSPLLPATTLSNYSYYNMFKNCSAMNVIKCLATNISATGCTTEWTDGVSSTGTFTKAASMSSWTTGINGIPSGWTTVSV